MNGKKIDVNPNDVLKCPYWDNYQYNPTIFEFNKYKLEVGFRCGICSGDLACTVSNMKVIFFVAILFNDDATLWYIFGQESLNDLKQLDGFVGLS